MSLEPYWSDGQVSLHLGDCLEVLPSLDAASVDAIVTDPPYGLEFMGKEWDGADGFRRSLNPADASRDNVFGRTSRTGPEYRTGSEARRAGTGYEGQSQVHLYQRWCQAWAAGCLRVLKPGGHPLAFGGTRTWHRLTCAIEDAGFEIRDSVADLTGIDGPGLAWLYGQGFPKSLDVSKAIDRGKRRDYVAAALRLGMAIPGRNLDDWTKEDHSPGSRWWDEFKAHLSADQWAAVEREIVAHGHSGASSVAYARPAAGTYGITAPATEDAARWEGWGTALKPAWEPVVVARKPLAGTVAANVLTHGTGALNIAGCLIKSAGESHERQGEASQETRYTGRGGTDFAALPGVRGGGPDGRWPPNVALGGEAAAELDRQGGVLTSGANPARRSSDKFRDAYGELAGQAECVAHRGVDSGGASRFFPVFRYEAKASSGERPRLDDGTAHPTVKPVDLIRWLCRLVTPPGGLILDPFAGSGTTAEAAIVEGFRCVLIEQDPKSVELIRTRLRKDIQPGMFGGAA
jgi:DNA modification methylase